MKRVSRVEKNDKWKKRTIQGVRVRGTRKQGRKIRKESDMNLKHVVRENKIPAEEHEYEAVNCRINDKIQE